MRVHELKTWPMYFEAVAMGIKSFELRKNDRDFAVNDYVRLWEYWPEPGQYTARFIEAKIIYIFRSSGFEGPPALEESHVILQLDVFGPGGPKPSVRMCSYAQGAHDLPSRSPSPSSGYQIPDEIEA